MFCVSLALQHKGKRIAGVVYDPTRDELFAAEQGSGAFLNQQRIHVSKTANLSECLVATGFPSHKRHKNPNIFFYHHITLRTHGVRRAGSAALDLCYVAAGRLDGFWEFNLNSWDTAAGVLIVEEAGGRVTDFEGSPFEFNSRETLASNGMVHQALMTEFEQIFAGRDLNRCQMFRRLSDRSQPRLVRDLDYDAKPGPLSCIGNRITVHCSCCLPA